MDFNDENWRTWAGLMVQAQDGDMDAYAKLLAGISPMIFNFVRKRVFNQQYAQDVHQDVLLTFHKALHTYQRDRDLSPWLFAVVRNAVWTSLQKNRKFVERELLWKDLPEIAWSAPDDEGLDDRLHKALNSIPPENRQAVELLKLKDMSVESAARALGISKIALKVRAHRGYVQLRKILSKEDKNE